MEKGWNWNIFLGNYAYSSHTSVMIFIYMEMLNFKSHSKFKFFPYHFFHEVLVNRNSIDAQMIGLDLSEQIKTLLTHPYSLQNNPLGLGTGNFSPKLIMFA